MSNRKKGLKNFLYMALGQVVSIAFGLVLPRLLIVRYGSEVNGLLSSLTQLLAYLNLFEAGIGSATLQALYKPLALDDWDSVSSVMSASAQYYRRASRWYLIGLLLLTVTYPLIIDTQLPFGTVCGAVFFSGAGNVVLFYFQSKYRYLLQADGKSYIITNLTTITSVFASLCKIVLIYRGTNIAIILAITFLIQCLQIFYIFWYVRSYSKLRMDAPPDLQAVSQKNAVLVHQISGLIFQNTDVVILTVVCGLRVVSIYSTFKLVTSALESILSILLNSVSFFLGQTYQTNRRRFTELIDLVDSYYSAVLYAVSSVALFLYLPFIRLYTAGAVDVNYLDAWLPPLFVGIMLLYNSRLVMTETVIYAGHFQATVPYTVIEAVINLGVSLIAVQFWGIYGVLIGTIIAMIYRVNQVFLYSNHKLLNRSARRTYVIYAVNVGLFLAVQALLACLFGGIVILSYQRFLLVGLGAALLSICIFVAGQTLIFPHCRRFVRQLLSTMA